jgi:hypothetical protein
MTPHDAAKILDLPVDATPEQIETRFNELRAKLEDKVAKAPTPGLKAKYRESLEEITTAFETLTLAADASSLPVLQRQRTEDIGPKTAKPAAPVGGVPPPREASPSPASPRKKSGGGEFLIVAIIALAVLGAGGWWVMKTRAENAEKARLAVEHAQKAAAEKAEAERQAQLAKEKAEQEKLAQVAAEKAEKERLEKLFTSLRSRMAELNVAYDALMRVEQAAERELSELKSQERDLAREQKAAPTPELRRLSAQVRAQDRLVGWLRDTLPTHPAKVSRAKTEEFLSARAVDDAAAAITAYADAIAQLKKEIAEARLDLAVTGSLKLSANLEGATWQLVDAFGVDRTGAAPAELDDVALGKGNLTFRRQGWPDQKYTIDVRPGGGTANGQFPIGALRITSEPAGAQIYRGDKVIGTTPLAIDQLPPSQVEVRIAHRGFRSQKLAGKIEDGKTLTLEATLQTGHTVDTDFILESLPAELAAISDPQARVGLMLGILTVARQLNGIEKSSLRDLMDAHLATCRAIPDPKKRLDALSYPSRLILPAIDFSRSRAWAELAATTVPTIGMPADRQQALFQIESFSIHPDLQVRMASAMINWFPGADEWTYRGIVAQRFAEAGAEADAQRALARAMDPSNEYQNKAVRDYVATGRQARLFLPVRLALIKGDLAAAQRELGRYTGQLDFSELYSTASEFIRLGDPDSALRMGRLAQTQYLTAATTTSTLINAATAAGNYPLAERWAATLTDTAESPARSQAFLAIANAYLTNGRTAEALQAINNVVTFTSLTYVGDRYQCALILAQLGETTRARNLIRGHPIAFTKDESVKLWYAAALFAVLGDSASADRALRVIQSDSADYFTAAMGMVIQALGQTGKFEEAKEYQARMNIPAESSNVHYALAAAQVRRTSDDELGDLYEQASAGMGRATILYSILARDLDRQNLARYSAQR